MKPPRFPINTPAKVTQAREYLGLDKAGMARALRFGAGGRESIRRMEDGTAKSIPGPTQIAIERLIEGKAK